MRHIKLLMQIAEVTGVCKEIKRTMYRVQAANKAAGKELATHTVKN